MTRPDIVAIGHICTDKIHIIAEFPEENTSRRVLEYAERTGGTASTAAVAAARLGARVGYLNYFGDDNSGKALYEDCVREGLDLSCARVVPGGISAFTNVLVNQQHATRTFLSFRGKFPPIEFDARCEEYIRNAQVIHLDGVQYDNALAAAKLAKKCGTCVSLDGSSMHPDNEKNRELASLADILIVNETYAQRLTGIADEREAFKTMAEWMPAAVLVATRGEKGCYCRKCGALFEYEAFSTDVVDTTGAGDAFHGGFLYSYLSGASLDQAIAFASAVGALNCRGVGGREALPDYRSVIRFLNEHGGISCHELD